MSKENFPVITVDDTMKVTRPNAYKVLQLRAELKQHKEAFDELYEFLNHMPFEFKKGITDPTGTIDEGDVLGNKYYCELMEKYRPLAENKG